MVFRLPSQKRVYIGDSDRFKRPSSIKHLLEEWSYRVATVLNCFIAPIILSIRRDERVVFCRYCWIDYGASRFPARSASLRSTLGHRARNPGCHRRRPSDRDSRSRTLDVVCYLSLTLAAYVGEDVTIRFDPRDTGEIRVFYKDRFLCQAVSAELAGETIPLRDIVRVRNQRRRELSTILHDRQQLVDSLLQLKKECTPKEIHENAATPSVAFPVL